MQIWIIDVVSLLWQNIIPCQFTCIVRLLCSLLLHMMVYSLRSLLTSAKQKSSLEQAHNPCWLHFSACIYIQWCMTKVDNDETLDIHSSFNNVNASYVWGSTCAMHLLRFSLTYVRKCISTKYYLYIWTHFMADDSTIVTGVTIVKSDLMRWTISIIHQYHGDKIQMNFFIPWQFENYIV
jgi:hypothetical protein